jgi:hypothetical protein
MIKQNFRQRSDLRYLELLTKHLREGLTKEDISLLSSRVINRKLVPPPKTPIIVNRNCLRKVLNNHFVAFVSAYSGEEKLTINAIDSCSNKEPDLESQQVKTVLLSIDDNKTDNLPGELTIFKGMKCMITSNWCYCRMVSTKV